MIQQFKNIEQASNAAVDQLTKLVRKAVSEKGFCSMVLAGGKTPRLTYELLGTVPNTEQMPWEQIHFFWSDERWLADNHPDSNYYMIYKALLAKVPIPPGNIHKIATGYTNPETGAEMYEKQLRVFFHSQSLGEMQRGAEELNVPGFDLALLGMGADGHTASLFPGSDLLKEKRKWVGSVPEGVGTPPVARITLTLPALNLTENIIFLISGNRKREILQTILTRPEEAEKIYPAARIKPTGKLIWLVAEKDD